MNDRQIKHELSGALTSAGDQITKLEVINAELLASHKRLLKAVKAIKDDTVAHFKLSHHNKRCNWYSLTMVRNAIQQIPKVR